MGFRYYEAQWPKLCYIIISVIIYYIILYTGSLQQNWATILCNDNNDQREARE